MILVPENKSERTQMNTYALYRCVGVWRISRYHRFSLILTVNFVYFHFSSILENFVDVIFQITGRVKRDTVMAKAFIMWILRFCKL